MRFRFRGKSGKDYELRLHDRRLAGLVRSCHDLPGQVVFSYIDAAAVAHQVRSEDVNDYLGRISGADPSERDFRTWAGTVLAYRELGRQGDPEPAPGRPRQVVVAVDAVSHQLENTRTVARTSYIHRAVTDAWSTGALVRCPRRVCPGMRRLPPHAPRC